MMVNSTAAAGLSPSDTCRCREVMKIPYRPPPRSATVLGLPLVVRVGGFRSRWFTWTQKIREVLLTAGASGGNSVTVETSQNLPGR